MSEQLVNLENLEKPTLLNVLDRYFIEYEIDGDGDIFLEKPTRLYLEINKEKGVLRMYGFIHYNDFPNSSYIPKFINKFNKNSYTLTYTLISEKSILCEYHIFLLGSIDEKGLIKSIKRTESEIIQTKEYCLYAKEITEE